MQVVVIETPELGDRSYLVHDGATGFVVDPQRDIERFLAEINAAGVKVSHVFETHIHNDYLTGGLALAGELGAQYVVAGADQVDFSRVPAGEGSEFRSGSLVVTALHTPGHTPNHLAYQVAESGRPQAVFTGGSLLYGTVGRTDLISPEATDELTHQQFHSARRLMSELGPEVRVMPTHGFGSFCASSGTAEPGDGDIASERRHNLASKVTDEQAFVATVVGGLGPFPTYYRFMAPQNRRGPKAFRSDGAGEGVATEPGELQQKITQGEWVVDTRPRRAFAAGHLEGTLSMELYSSFTTYMGWLAPYEKPVTLLAENEDVLFEARRDLARIGMDRITGSVPGFSAAAQILPVHSYPVRDFGDLRHALGDKPVVLDVRQPEEWGEGHIEGAVHLPLQEIPDHLSDLPSTQMWVHCHTGFRASVAASLLDRAGRDIVLLDDDFDNAKSAGLPIVR